MIMRLCIVTLVLAVANIAVYSIALQPATTPSTSSNGIGCGGGPQSQSSIADLAAATLDAVRNPLVAEPPVEYDCSNCTIQESSNIHWCEHRATICPDDPWPWHENYEKE